MSTTSTLLQTAVNVQIFPLMRGLFGLAALAGLLVFFKPLLVGLARAMYLVVRPRMTLEQRQARRQMCDAETLQQVINSSNGPSDAAELRALAART